MKLTSFYAAPRLHAVAGADFDGLLRQAGVAAGRDFSAQPDWPEHGRAHDRVAAEIAGLCDDGHWQMARGRCAAFLPTRHGFDHYLGLPYSNDMGGEVPGKDTDKWKKHTPPLPLVRDEEVIETLEAA